MALPRPTKFPEWARVPYIDPVKGGSNIVEPSEQKKDDGWLRNEKPPGNMQNWLHNLTDEWLKYLDSLSTGGTFTTGDWKFSDKLIENPLIWLLADDGTIGNDSSVADHKGDEFKDLFIFYWDTYDNSKCPVLPGGRGVGTAEDDWNANKNLQILTKKDRFPAAASATAEYLPGDIGGADAVALTVANQNAPHQHDGSSLVGTTTIKCHNTAGESSSPTNNFPGKDVEGKPWETTTDTSSMNVGMALTAITGNVVSNGGGGTHENRPLYFASNIFIKL